VLQHTSHKKRREGIKRRESIYHILPAGGAVQKGLLRGYLGFFRKNQRLDFFHFLF
jgi:hypothetical protein